MANVKIVPKDDWEIIQNYLGGEEAVVLVPEENLGDPEKFSPENAQLVREYDNENIMYDFGGEADCWVDTCSSDQHFLLDFLKR